MARRPTAVYAVGEYLARWPTGRPVPDSSSIAENLELGHSSVAEWRRHFRFHQALLQSPQGEMVDLPRLLQVLTAHRLARMTPALEEPWMYNASSLSECLQQRGIPHTLAMLSAANEWAFYEPRRTVQIYVPRSALPAVREIEPEVALFKPGLPGLQVFVEDFKTLPVVERNGLPVTNAFFTLLDCRAHPEGGAHAHFLESQRLRWGPD